MHETSPRAERTLRYASSVGTVIEWYDFFAFASAAALVFDRAFFPRVDPLVGVLLGLMIYAVGFVTRPVGGILFGVLGDRVGRKRALVWSLVLMGLATMAVGLVPTYATIGVAAPLLLVLLRLTQGVAVGGMSAFFVELFPTAARYTGFSVGYQLATVGAGAVAPLVGVALLDRFGSTVPVSLYAAAMALPGLAALWRSRETRGVDLARVE